MMPTPIAEETHRELQNAARGGRRLDLHNGITNERRANSRNAKPSRSVGVERSRADDARARGTDNGEREQPPNEDEAGKWLVAMNSTAESSQQLPV